VTDSIEVDEATYPILIEERRICEDSMGFGQWNGAPAVKGSYRSLTGDLTLYVCGDGGTFPAKGVLGGQAGATCGTWRRDASDAVERVADFYNGVFAQDEAVLYRSCAGGGYGAPRRRDAERVLEDVNRKWLSVAAARDMFGVVVALDENGVDYRIDGLATQGLRENAPDALQQ
jgi:N-methylhydantoinase B